MLRKNFRNISYQSIAQIVPRAMMFLFVMYLARVLGGTEYGKYEFAVSLGYLVGMFFELGGNMILTKHVARNFYSSIYYALKIRLYSIAVTLAVFYIVLFTFGLYKETHLYGGNNPGTKMDIKKLDFDKYIGLARMIVSEFPDLKIIFFEGTYSNEKFSLPEDLKAVKETIKNELIACCDYFVSGDTGSLHIAAAMGVPTVSIFGPSDPRILSPVNPDDSARKHLYVWKKPECSPCYTPETAIDKTNMKYWKNNNFVCHTGTHKCMSTVTYVEIYTELRKLIGVTEHVN